MCSCGTAFLDNFRLAGFAHVMVLEKASLTVDFRTPSEGKDGAMI
jgi:hypothetical protein